MNTYRITVAYDGTAYRGWQRQENTELTVQGILERRISEIAGKKTVVSGSGRTDSGVHALGQECSLYLEQEIDMDSFKKQLNALLPEDIRVLDISREKRDFHARKSAVGKCYEYQIDLRDKMEVFHRKYRFHFPHPVDIAAMEKAAEYLMGTHDFSAFTDLKEDKDTVRTIYAVGIVYEKDTLTLSWIGDGFLYHMVRILTGTLLDVGIGKIKAEEIPEILKAKDRKKSGFPAPAKGLFLGRVFYSELDIPYEVQDYVATHIKSSIRELEGALTKLSAFSKLSHTDITVEFAEQTLKDLISPDAKKEITPELIIQTVADHFNVKYDDIISSKRNANIVHPRQIAMYLCRQMTTAPLQAVGKALGNRDHTTVIHGAEKIAKEVVQNESVRNTIDIIIKKINPS